MYKSGLRRTLSLILCAVLLLNNAPLVFAEACGDLCEHHTEHADCGYVVGESACGYDCDECAQPPKEPVEIQVVESTTESVTEQIIPNAELPDSAELFEGFVQRELYGQTMSTFGVSARKNLNDAEKGFYDALKPQIEAVALSGGSTVFTISDMEGLKTSWSNTELGVSSIDDVSVVKALFAAQFDLNEISNALLSDCPFDLYWFDKTVGIHIGYKLGRSGYDQDGQPVWDSAVVSEITVSFAVSSDYSAGENAVTTQVAKVATARNTAAQVVANNASKTDYEKLMAYKAYICDAVSYNHAAADDNTTPYGDPWQLISVFDGDNETNVVCEGYSKAFMYLCDLTIFAGDVTCYTVDGQMAGGGHMWNIVTLEGKNYLVDVTNSDSGTIGQDGSLFLAGASGSAAAGYYVSDIFYTYDADTKSMWGTGADSILTLATESYTPGQSAQPIPEGLVYEIVENGGSKTVTITDYTGSATELTIPATIEGYPVTTIGDSAFKNCTSLERIVFPNSITSMGTNVLSGCSSLESVTIPFVGDSRKTASDTYQYPFGYLFGTSSYAGGTGTYQYYYGSSTTSSTASTYYIPTSLKSVTVTGGNILYCAFDDCNNLTSVTLGDGITSIGDYAFRSCSSLTSVTLPDSITSIGDYAFYWCESLTSITLPDSITSIGEDAFYWCKSLASITLPDGITSIGNYAFYNCRSLTSITLPEGVTSIGNYAFFYCSSLTSITIPDSVTSIGSSVLSGCSSLESITIPFVGDSRKTAADTYQYPLGYLFGTSSYTGGTETYQYYYGSSTTSTTGSTYYIPTSLKSVTVTGGNILRGAFYNCSNLTSITLPDSITSIGDYAFRSCSSLTNITLPDSITSIRTYAFYNCDNLTSITLPDGITSIGDYAFRSCSSLTSITLPDGITSIGDSAFEYCSNLTSVTLPDSITSIGYEAFYNCSSLQHVYYGGTEIQWSAISKGSFNYSLTDAKRHSESDGSALQPYENTTCTVKTLFKCTECGDVLVDKSYSGSHIYENGICTVCGYAENLTGLIYAIQKDQVTITDYTGSATELNIPAIIEGYPVTTIGNYAFSSHRSLTSITLPEGVTSIGGGAFYNCTRLTSIALPDSVTSIGEDAFSYCSSLTSITIPEGVTSIDYGAFYKCGSLQHVYYGGTEIQWSAISVGSSNTSLTNAKRHSASDGSDLQPYEQTTCTIQRLYQCAECGDILYNKGYPGTHTYENGECIVCGYAETLSGLKYAVHNETITITDYTGTATKLTIPSTIEGYPVTSIGNYAFSSCSSLTSITLPEGITSIGKSAFDYCSSLQHVYYGGTEIQWSAISVGSYNTSLTNAKRHTESDGSALQPYEKTTCTIQSLYQCTDCGDVLYNREYKSMHTYKSGVCVVCGLAESLSGLTYTAYNETITITDYTGSATELTIPATIEGYPVTTIGNSAFSSCSSLSSITLPEGVVSIGSYAFRDCTSLTSITIPDSITSIGNYAFYNCSSLTSVTLPDSITSIGDYAFYNCRSLTSITLPEGVTSIDYGAFYNCSSLTSITLPEGVVSIGSYAFQYCSSLTSIAIPEGVTSIGYCAFEGCSNLQHVYYAGTNSQWSAISMGSYNFSLTDAKRHYQCTSEEGHWVAESKDATCTEAAYSKEKCPCGYVRNEVIGSALGHDMVTDTGYAATCTTAGKTDGCHCSRCDAMIVAQQEIPALGHYVSTITLFTKENDVTYPFVLGEDGWYASSNKSNSTTSAFKIQAAHSCTLVLNYKVSSESGYDKLIVMRNGAAKDTISGSVSDKTISLALSAGDIVYIKYTKDSSQYAGTDTGYFKIVTSEQGVVSTDDVDPTCENAVVCISCDQVMKAALSHTPGAEADCETAQTCTVCGEVLNAALGHTEVIDDAAVAPTCTAAGLTEGKHCSVCNKVLTTQETVPALGHTPGAEADCETAQTCTVCGDVLEAALGHTEAIDAAVAPTCTATGLTEGKHCSVCNKVLVAQDTVAALGHTPGAEADCETAQTCTVCGDVLNTALGHTEAIDAAVAPTCTATGLTEGKHCSVCNKVLVAQETVPALGHTPGAEADCETAQTCTVCGDVLNAALGHTEVIDAAVAPTCTETGLTEGKHCSVCNKVLVAQETVPALGHTPGAEADCENAQTCTVCGDVLNTALGHTEEIDAAVAPTCTATGLTEGTHCSVCNKVLTTQETVPALDHSYVDGKCERCDQPEAIPGDIDGDNEVTEDDAVYLLLHTMFGNAVYPVNGNTDFDGDGSVTQDDAVYLLLHTMFGEMFYPINTPALPVDAKE